MHLRRIIKQLGWHFIHHHDFDSNIGSASLLSNHGLPYFLFLREFPFSTTLAYQFYYVNIHDYITKRNQHTYLKTYVPFNGKVYCVIFEKYNIKGNVI